MSLEPQTAFDLTCRLYGLASALTWAEEWAIARRSGLDLRPTGAIPAASMAAVGVVAFLAPETTSRQTAVVLLAVVALAAALRARLGRDASDDMQMIVGIALVAGIALSDEFGQKVALEAIAAHMGVCYLVSALLKAVGRGWRNGSALAGVLATEAFGAGWQPLGLRWTLAAAGWAVVVVELLLPIGFLVGGPVTAAAVAVGLGLHLGIAVTMGLSRFPVTWAAGYPALVWWAGQNALLS